MGARIVPTDREVATAVKQAFSNSEGGPADGWMVLSLDVLEEAILFHLQKGIPAMVAVRAVLTVAIEMGGVFERAGYD